MKRDSFWLVIGYLLQYAKMKPNNQPSKQYPKATVTLTDFEIKYLLYLTNAASKKIFEDQGKIKATAKGISKYYEFICYKDMSISRKIMDRAIHEINSYTFEEFFLPLRILRSVLLIQDKYKRTRVCFKVELLSNFFRLIMGCRGCYRR